jgi:hypothetical protein
MNKCGLCKKEFEFPYLLERHKNRKTPCNIIKTDFECKVCNISFNHKSRLEAHDLSKKHIQNYNNHIEKINKETTKKKIKYNGFKETYIEIISLKDITNLLSNHNIALTLLKEFMNEPNSIYFESDLIINIFKFFIELFAKLNFNLAFDKNHNCAIYSFNKFDNNLIEYQILVIDNINKSYHINRIQFSEFIDEFLNLLDRINKRFFSEVFEFMLFYVNKYKHFLFNPNSKAKYVIEQILLTSYDSFDKARTKIHLEEVELNKTLSELRYNALKHIFN